MLHTKSAADGVQMTTSAWVQAVAPGRLELFEGFLYFMRISFTKMLSFSMLYKIGD